MATDLDHGRVSLSQSLQRGKFRLSLISAAIFLTLTNVHFISRMVNRLSPQLRAYNSNSNNDFNQFHSSTFVDDTVTTLSLNSVQQEEVSTEETTVNTSIRRRPSIVLFGDSLTQRGFGEDGTVGWASLLSSAYTRRADVKNRGFGGYNTHHALHVWPNIEDAYDDNILFSVLFFGANDAALPESPQHISLEEYRTNLVELVTKIRSRLVMSNPGVGSTIPIFLFTPPPVDEIRWAQFRNKTESNRLNEVTRAYGDAVKQVVNELQQKQAQQYSLSVVDTWELLEGSNVTAYPQYLSDGLHLNARGNQRIYEGFMDLLHRDFPLLAPKTDNHEIGIPFEEKRWQDYD